jgi:hypothetical protein
MTSTSSLTFLFGEDVWDAVECAPTKTAFLTLREISEGPGRRQCVGGKSGRADFQGGNGGRWPCPSGTAGLCCFTSPGHACPKGRVAESLEIATIFLKMKCGNCARLLFAKDTICPDCGAHIVERQTFLLTPGFLMGVVALVVFIYLVAVKF